MIASKRIFSNRDVKRIVETRGNTTVEGRDFPDFPVIETNFDRQILTPHMSLFLSDL